MLEKTQSTEIENIYNRNKNKYILAFVFLAFTVFVQLLPFKA